MRASAMKREKAPANPRSAALKALRSIEALIATGIAALERTRIDETSLQTQANCLTREATDLRRSLQTTILQSNLWPGRPPFCRASGYGHESNDEEQAALTRLQTTLLARPPADEHECVDDDVCLLFHRTLPRTHTPAWHAWKAAAAEHLACPGQRAAIAQRLAEAEADAESIRLEYDGEASVDEEGELHIARAFDPWPDLHVGMMDESTRLRVTRRTVWGYEPDEVEPDDAGDHPQSNFQSFARGFIERTKEHYDVYGLRCLIEREYVEPTVGEWMPLRFVPIDHNYQRNVGEKVRRRNDDDDTALRVLYLGPQKEEQLDLLSV
jgi:hypothetical protein